MEINYYQIGILIIQCVLISGLILLLFSIRLKIGISLLYAALGLFQYMQVFLASTVYVEIAKGILVSPGSSVLFAGSLFAVLLIYIKEDATETRKIIYALLISNIIISILLFVFGLHFNGTDVYNPLNVSTKFFDYNAWVLLIGTITLFIDAILIIILFEFISKYVSNLLLRIYLTMILVLSFDTVFFSLLAFWNYDNLKSIIASGIIAKNSSVIIYGFIFYIYLKKFEKGKKSNPIHFKDVFHALSYKQKFEIVQNQKELELKNAEKKIKQSIIKYETLANITPVGVFLTKPNGYTTYVNPKWTTISGLSQSEALGYNWLNAVHPEDKIQTKKGWDLATNNKKSSYAEYRFIHPDGSIKWVLGQAVPEIDTDNQIIGYVGTITDITEIKNYEKELIKTKEKAEESDRLKTAFLHNLSHEIRTPMNAIIGFSGFLTKPNLTDEKRNNFISIIINSSNQLLSIVTDILTISLLETKQEKINIDKVNVKNLLTELITIFEPQAISKNISISVEYDLNDQQSEIYTDKTKVTQILSNLITNSLKFTSKGYVKFGYKIITKVELNEIEFFVKDTGIGIQPEYQEIIFEHFRQANKEIQQSFGGTGLGIAISKAFVELLGGKIWVQSEIKKGSTFYFTIPYNPVIETKKLSNKIPEISEPKMVLVADDDDYNYIYIKKLLSVFDIDTVRANDGVETIEICKSNSDINLILMDIKMPLITGDKAAQIIKSKNPDLPIIAQSAYAMGSEKAKYKGIFDDYMVKPISKEILIKIMNKYLITK